MKFTKNRLDKYFKFFKYHFKGASGLIKKVKRLDNDMIYAVKIIKSRDEETISNVNI